MKPGEPFLAPVAAIEPGSRTVEVSGLRGGQAFAGADRVAEEVPVALEFNGISHAVMLATPRDLEDFALGFSLAEGILDKRADLYDIEIDEAPEGITLRLEIAASCFARLKQYRRNLAGRTGCGLCGTESLAQALRPVPRVVHAFTVDGAAISRGLQAMRAQQVLQQATGAVHAAAWCNAEGEVVLLREDVGRHNALDKLVGALARAHVATDAGFALVTSRASYEMVQKAAMAGIGVLAAISAPTALAIQTAQAANLALAGFAREQDMVLYAHPERVLRHV
ncbi:MAG TPA: formate dehydrogenase accessory sulfurtransferase FdhD [Burkholderiales bacterium]|nr:formate dehydrogenase accessory sulfurtransferase FdhD [Burkholderiales bacterium]